MIAVHLATVLAGAVSAFVPAAPIEPYLLAVVTATGYHPVPLGVAAALGQTAGKLLTFLGARGALRSTRLRRWLAARLAFRTPPRVRALARPLGTAADRLTGLLDRPVLTVPIVFLSAVAGIPPLLATSVYAARTHLTAPTFTLVCLLGRSIRLVAVALTPDLVAR